MTPRPLITNFMKKTAFDLENLSLVWISRLSGPDEVLVSPGSIRSAALHSRSSPSGSRPPGQCSSRAPSGPALLFGHWFAGVSRSGCLMAGLCRGVVFSPFVRLGVNYQSHAPAPDTCANVNCLPLMREKADKQKGFTAHPSPPPSRTQQQEPDARRRRRVARSRINWPLPAGRRGYSLHTTFSSGLNCRFVVKCDEGTRTTVLPPDGALTFQPSDSPGKRLPFTTNLLNVLSTNQ